MTAGGKCGLKKINDLGLWLYSALKTVPDVFQENQEKRHGVFYCNACLLCAQSLTDKSRLAVSESEVGVYFV